jgi:hypothetical protein
MLFVRLEDLLTHTMFKAEEMAVGRWRSESIILEAVDLNFNRNTSVAAFLV